MKQFKYFFVFIVILLSTRIFNLRIFFIGTMVWDVVVSVLIIAMCLYILFTRPDCFYRKTFLLCLGIFLCSLIVDTFACFRLNCPYFTVIKAMKFIVPGPMLCFVLYRYYNKESDVEIVCNALKYSMIIYLLLQYCAYATHSYTLIFYDEFDSSRYDFTRQRNFAPCVECFMILVFVFYLMDIHSKPTLFYKVQKWLYLSMFGYFVVFIFMSKIYLVSIMSVLFWWLLYKKPVGIVRLLVVILALSSCILVIDYCARSSDESIFKHYVDDFKYDNNHSSWARQESLSGYYELFKETKGMGLGHATIHYDRDFAYLAIDRRITIYDIGAIGVFYQYGVSMIVLSAVILFYCINTIIKARVVRDVNVKKLSDCMSLFLVFIIVSLTPLWLHEIRACVCGLVFYFFMIIEDNITNHHQVVTSNRI